MIAEVEPIASPVTPRTLTVICFATRGTAYEEEARRLVESAERHGVRVHLETPEPAGSWVQNCAMKGPFVLEMLRKIGGPVLWLDADAEIKGPLDFFGTIDADVAAYRSPTGELLSGTVYLSGSPASIALAERWAELCRTESGTWDQKLLDRAIADTPHATVAQLPLGYCKIFDWPWMPGETADERIVHHQASRRLKKLVNAPATVVAPPAAVVETPDPTDQVTDLSDVSEGRLLFFTPARESINLDGWYKGRSCFLICGGPSLADSNLKLLESPGVFKWGMNNSWSVIRPNFWTCVDPPQKFCIEGWLDPTITKVVPMPLARSPLYYRAGPNNWKQSRTRVRDCPAVWLWQRNSRFDPAEFLTEPSVCWGCEEGHTDPLGLDGIRSVMLATMRLIHAVGFRTVYLVGADFKMELGKPNYAFAQDRAKSAVKHNNKLFEVMNKRLTALVPYLEMSGMKVWNCTPGSGLTAFPFMRLSEAVAAATKGIAGPMRTEGHYDKQQTAAERMEEEREACRVLWDHGGGD